MVTGHFLRYCTSLPLWGKQQNVYRNRSVYRTRIFPGGVIAGLRDKVIHGYIGVDYELLWEMISKKIPIVIEGLHAILDDTNR